MRLSVLLSCLVLLAVGAATLLAFEDDSQLRGKWHCVNFVNTPDEFDPTARPKFKLMWQEMVFEEKGKTNFPFLTWSKGSVFHSGDKSEAKYEIRTIDQKSYLFVQHMSGDVTIRGMAPKYYVFVKLHRQM